MPVFGELYKGSFRNISFLFTEERREGGKKTITHEYPFSNRRFTEELGKFPARFILQIIIFGSLQNRLDFERVLEMPGFGKLVHPFYGELKAKATTFIVSSSQTKIGQFNFTVTFELSASNITLEPVRKTEETVSKNTENGRRAMNDSFLRNYFEPKTALESSETRNKVIDAVTILSEVIDTLLDPNETKKILFTRQTSNFIKNAGVYVQSATTVVTELSTCFNYALDVVDSPDRLLLKWLQLSGFGYIVNPLDFTIGGQDRGTNVGKTNTIKRLHTETNRQIINEYVRVNALANAYESAAYYNFKTDQELNEIMKTLSLLYRLQFQDFYETSSELNILSNSANVRENMVKLRSDAISVYNEKIQNVWRVVDIDPGVSSMSLISYRYYESLSNINELIGLNPDIKTSFVKEPIKAFTT